MKRLLLALCFFLMPVLAHAASCSSYPFTLQNNTTADATQVMADFNNVRNCVINNAAGSGVNTDITSITGLSTPLSVPQGGTPVFIGGTSGGAANAQTVASTTPIGYSLTNGYRVTFIAGFTNTSTATLNVNTTGATAIKKLGHAGLEVLTGGEIAAGNVVEAIYDGTEFVLLSTPFSDIGPATSISSATSTDLGAVPSHNAIITGTTTITGFGSTATVNEPIYNIKFGGALTLTYNATSLLIPGQANITTAANDTAVVEYLGSGNWQVLSYTKYSGAANIAITPLCGAQGFTMANNSGTPNSIVDMAASVAVLLNSSNGVTVTPTGVSVSINATTTGANGLDTGSLTTSSWYYFYLISNGTATAGLASLSATAPAMPSGYIYACLLGAMKTDGSSNFYRIQTTGAEAQWVLTGGSNTTVNPVLASGTSGTCTASNFVSGTTITIATWAPTSLVAVVRGLLSNKYNGGVSAVACLSSNNVASAGVNGTALINAFVPSATDLALPFNIIPLGASMYYASDATGGGVLSLGWRNKVNAN